jgi:protein-L-isoaspartate(D-aspartate) O-methyltransferase
MYARGEINIGHLCKEYYNDLSYHIGFGTHTGTVAAAKNWGEKMEVMNVNESLKESYEYLCHKTNLGSFTLPLREKDSDERLGDLLKTPRLERAIGVIYRPDTERSSHYFRTVLNAQFDEYIFFDTTRAIKPIAYKTKKPKLMLNHPFGLLDE